MIKLSNGSTLEVSMFDGFYAKIRTQFDLSESEPITDEHIRMFFYGSLKNAIDKEDLKDVR
jgi:hypothetical protein